MAEDPTVGTQSAAETRPTSRSETRGFLFADIRGYTEYVERQGAAAAAELLLRYRAVVRDAITRNDGAEIRTEGDSFYVVLRSASDAVLCALDIVKGVAEENARNPGAPIRVGVGVHAGEAIDTAEGLVGSAINLAARVCALAGPGEVLVTDTVRGLARSVIPVTFTSRGNQRLKGVADPVEIFQVTESAAGTIRGRAKRRAWVLGAGLVATVIVGGAVVYSAAGFGSPRTSAAPTATPTPAAVGQSSTPAGSGAATPANPSLTPSATATGPMVLKWRDSGQSPEHLRGGTYQFDAFRPVITFDMDPSKTLGDIWWLTCDSADEANVSAWDGGEQFPSKGSGGPIILPSAECWNTGLGKPQFDVVRPSTVGDGDCLAAKSVRTPQDVIDRLSEIGLLKTTAAQQVTVAGRAGLSVDVELTGDVATFCPDKVDTGSGLILFPTQKKKVAIFPETRMRLILIDVGQTTPLVIRIQAPAQADIWSTALMRVQPLLDSMTIGP